MLINARSVKKSNAVFHLSTDLAAQSIDWFFVTESWLNSDIDWYFHLNSKLQSLSLWQIRKKLKKEPWRWGMFLCSEQFFCTQIYPQDNEQFEVLWLEIDIMSLCALLYVVYYPPLCDYDKDLCAYLIQAYEHLRLAKNYWQYIMCGDFNDFCTNNVIAECILTQINCEPTHNNNVLDKFLVSCPYIDSWNRYSDCFNRPRFSIMFFADSQKWKKSLLFQRPTWKLPPNVLQTSSWCEL